MHEIVKCKCGWVIRQCRCPGPHAVRYETCDKCKLATGTAIHGQFQERLDALVEKAKADPRGLDAAYFARTAMALGLDELERSGNASSDVVGTAMALGLTELEKTVGG